jgi:hypothetical protein
MLLGHASRLLAAHTFTPEELLPRLYGVARLETFPESPCFELSAFDDELALARDGTYSTPSDVLRDFAAFLTTFEAYAPDTSTGNHALSLGSLKNSDGQMIRSISQ